METLSTLDIILALLATLGILSLLGVIILQHRKTGDLITALTDGLRLANDNTKALDLVEAMATKVVPVSAVKALNQGADLLETLTPDDLRARETVYIDCYHVNGDANDILARKIFDTMTIY
jgi:hypothetical protein